ncbi:hypothetical protein C1X29_28600 [Pseudomonas sp. GW456-12-10-14-LB2]|nr:hypothetical protein C1X29_28600 [Pseudomonas sp. GW456-12-10-14-LB2]
MEVEVDPALSAADGHAVALDVRHRLLHEVDFLSDAAVHVCAGGRGHRVAAHAHDGLPPHAH